MSVMQGDRNQTATHPIFIRLDKVLLICGVCEPVLHGVFSVSFLYCRCYVFFFFFNDTATLLRWCYPAQSYRRSCLPKQSTVFTLHSIPPAPHRLVQALVPLLRSHQMQLHHSLLLLLFFSSLLLTSLLIPAVCVSSSPSNAKKN
jgi:hypothetical protein